MWVHICLQGARPACDRHAFVLQNPPTPPPPPPPPPHHPPPTTTHTP